MSAQHLDDGCLETIVGIGDDELEAGRDLLACAGTPSRSSCDDVPISTHRTSRRASRLTPIAMMMDDRDDQPTGRVGGTNPQVRPTALEPPIEEGLHLPSISLHRHETWLLGMPLMPNASSITRSQQASTAPAWGSCRPITLRGCSFS